MNDLKLQSFSKGGNSINGLVSVFFFILFYTCSMNIANAQIDNNANYLVEHYWDNLDMTDVNQLPPSDIFEQAMVGYIKSLYYADLKTVEYSLHKTLERAEGNKPIFNLFFNMLKQFLNNPNSPLRNDDFFLPVLTYIIKSADSKPADVQRAVYERELILKNKVGTKAANVIYTLANGQTKHLYDINSPYTILMFYNPGCQTCEETVYFLKQSDLIARALKNKQLTLLAVYPDKELSTWEKYQPNIPVEWINSYDKERILELKHTYDLQAIPTLYLLDKNKTVLLKDAPVGIIVKYLQEYGL